LAAITVPRVGFEVRTDETRFLAGVDIPKGRSEEQKKQ
jgi:hypothetical protein